MELLLEFVIEFFFEIVIDGGMELQHNERVPRWISYGSVSIQKNFGLGIPFC